MGLLAYTAEAYARMMKALLPPGRLWRLEPESKLSALFLAAGDELARIGGRAGDLLRQVDPRKADELIPEFEAELELDSTGTIEERRARVASHLIRRQRYRPADFQEALAPLLGLESGDVRVIERGRRFAEIVEDDQEIFRFFVLRDPDLPGDYDLDGAQALVDRMRPARSEGHLIESALFLCDDEHSLCDRDILGHPPETVTLDEPGEHELEAPAGEVTVEAWGGGGASHASSSLAVWGAGGGAYSAATKAYAAPTLLQIAVGAGGETSSSSGEVEPGGDSSVEDSAGVVALAKGGGRSLVNAGGDGGAAGDGVGDVRRSGGDGGARAADQFNDAGGGGGGSATASANGSDGAAAAGSTGGPGGAGEGAGGDGGDSSQAGQDGNAPGGGAGGQGANSGQGADGARGRVIIELPPRPFDKAFLPAAPAITVPTDGPQGVYVPTTEEHFAQLGIPAPTLCYPCDDENGNLVPSIGALELAPNGSGHTYEQPVSGWNRLAVGVASGSGNRWGATRSLASGESVIALFYTSFAAAASAILASAHGNGAGSSGPAVFIDDSQIQVRRGGFGSLIAEDHSGLSAVRPYLPVRNATDNESLLSTDLGISTVTHSEPESLDQVFSLGNPAGGLAPDSRFLYAALWAGAEADALIAAGLANETLLTLLGWSLSHP